MSDLHVEMYSDTVHLSSHLSRSKQSFAYSHIYNVRVAALYRRQAIVPSGSRVSPHAIAHGVCPE